MYVSVEQQSCKVFKSFVPTNLFILVNLVYIIKKATEKVYLDYSITSFSQMWQVYQLWYFCIVFLLKATKNIASLGLSPIFIKCSNYLMLYVRILFRFLSCHIIPILKTVLLHVSSSSVLAKCCITMNFFNCQATNILILNPWCKYSLWEF